MKMPTQNYKTKSTEFLIIIIAILFLCAGAYVIAGWMGEDVEAKNEWRRLEPNEPEPQDTPKFEGDFTLSYMPPDMPDNLFKIDITKHIPTWPDYIELDKDLVIDMSHKNDPNNPTIHYIDYVIEKGTKIYFKE